MLAAPLVCIIVKERSISSAAIEYFGYANKSLMFVTATLLAATLLSYGQKKLFEFGSQGPQLLYEKIRQQIIEWFKETQSRIGENQIKWTDEHIGTDSRLYHLEVMGNPDRILAQHRISSGYDKEVAEYCKCVHFEITNYPAELLYGIHFEFDSAELNQVLCESAKEILAIDKQYPVLQVDTEVPKKPSWIFLTLRVLLEGDFHKELPEIATHARHFVELVGHTFELIYGKEMIKRYIEWLGKQESNHGTNQSAT